MIKNTKKIIFSLKSKSVKVSVKNNFIVNFKTIGRTQEKKNGVFSPIKYGLTIFCASASIWWSEYKKECPIQKAIKIINKDNQIDDNTRIFKKRIGFDH